MTDGGDLPWLPSLVDELAAARVAGVSWRALAREFFDACRVVRDLGISEPLRPQIGAEAVADAVAQTLPLWASRWCCDLDLSTERGLHAARERFRRARKKAHAAGT
jgi:hypothetical protein